MKAAVIRITGDVQGVGFRLWAVDAAKRLGITGFARNEADGSVSIEAQGDERALSAFQSLCAEGPSEAVVREVWCSHYDKESRYETFQIVY